MPAMQTGSSAPDYSKLERTLFSRSRLEGLRCVVVGAGALGNEVVRILGLLNVGDVLVVDPDIVEASNLPRSTFFFSYPKSLGRNKALALAEAASEMFPGVHWIGAATEIADVGFQDASRADLWFSCVDTDLVRTEIAYISTKIGMPVVDAGLGMQNYSHGRVTYFPGTPDRACYCCMLTSRRRRQILEMWHAPLHSCATDEHLQGLDLVSTPTMASVVGALQVELGLRFLFQSSVRDPAETTSFEIRLHPERKLSEFVIQRSEGCPFHSQDREPLRDLPRPGCTVRELLENWSGRCLELDWPICTRARCLVCGHAWEPMVRLATLRRRARCPDCEAQRILDLEVVRTIDRASPWADLTISQLGLPENHLFTMR
jgi:hypothetical protein